MARSVYDEDEEFIVRSPQGRPSNSAYGAEQRAGRRETTRPDRRQPRTPVRYYLGQDELDGYNQGQRLAPSGSRHVNGPLNLEDEDNFVFGLERERRVPVGLGKVGNAPLASGKGVFGTGQAISSTISKDMTRGQGARNAALLGEFGKKSTKSMGTWTRDRPGAKPPVIVRGPPADVSSRDIDTDFVLYPEAKYAPNSRERTRPSERRQYKPEPPLSFPRELTSLSRYREDEGSQDYMVRGARVVPRESPRQRMPVAYSGISRGPVRGAERELVRETSPPPPAVIVANRLRGRRAQFEY